MYTHLGIGAGIILGMIVLFLILPIFIAPRVDRLVLAYLRLRFRQGGMIRAEVAEALHQSMSCKKKPGEITSSGRYLEARDLDE